MGMSSRCSSLGSLFGMLVSTGLWVACGSNDGGTESAPGMGGIGADADSGGSSTGGSDAGSTGARGGSAADTGGTSSSGAGGPSGGSVATGGATSKGGATDSGGAAGSGGATGAGGSQATGGSEGVGGSSQATGGSGATGGLGTTGGAQGTGGRQDTGGSTGTGGRQGSGGSPGTGGRQGTGGSAGTGGSQSTGGAAPTGGNTATGGEPTNCNIPTPSATPVGYGSKTTGGGNASAVSVSSFDAAVAALDDYRSAYKDGTAQALVVRYTGHFDYGTITDVCAQHSKDAQILYIKEVENVTFEGASGSSANFGIKINRAKNVIVRNMTMGLLPGGGDADCITIEGNGTNGDVENVWIDHNDLFSSTKDDCEGAGDTEFDGLIDIKKGARYITISYNKLHDHQKTGLLGSSDDDDTQRYVTFHHNWYDNVVSRTPLQRFGYTHIFNNYFNEISSSGINVRMGGVALIESNYFENAANPVTSRYSPEAGYWDLRSNFVGGGITWTTESDTLANAEDWKTTKAFPSSELNYSYEPDPAECVKQIVMATAGAKL
jgi:pectate lyase